MSFCPTRDIHSIYLDNEMPEVYKAEYEEHLKVCEKCRTELEKIKKLHSVFTADASSLNLDKTFMDQSFERLQMKMKYSKTVNAGNPKNSFKYFRQYASVAAVAACMCLAIMLPLRGLLNKKAESGTQTAMYINPVKSAENVSLNSGNIVSVSGNIHKQVLASGRSTDVHSNFKGSMRTADGLVQSVGYGNVASSRVVKDIDVFQPAFVKEDNPKSIKISVPDMNNMPVQIEITFPDAE